MTYEEYMEALEGQIQNTRAKDLVRQEFHNHIEEQADSYEEEGMDKDTALLAAIRQMGDPVKTGQELNRIHRPKFPIRLLALAAVLTIFGIYMQWIIFSHIVNTPNPPINTQDSWISLPITPLSSTIAYNILGLILVLSLLYFNYNYFNKYIFIFYGLCLCFIVAEGALIHSYNTYWTFDYFTWMVYPLIFAGLLYRFRNQGIRGILICEGLTLLVLLEKIFFPGLATFTSGTIECYLIITILLFLAIYKGIFGPATKKLFAGGCLIFSPGLMLLFLGVSGFLPSYYIERLKALLAMFSSSHPEVDSSYLLNRLRENISQYSLLGGSTLPDYLNPNELYSNFMLTSAFSWFGIIPGLLVLILLIVFCVLALKSALSQSNRLGMLLGSACGISILIRVLTYSFSNFGYGLYYTVSIPFLAYGGLGILLNGLYIGLVLCVFRNTHILKEG